jgi:hypothetical protein
MERAQAPAEGVSRAVPRHALLEQDVAKPADDLGACEGGITGGSGIAGESEERAEGW